MFIFWNWFLKIRTLIISDVINIYICYVISINHNFSPIKIYQAKWLKWGGGIRHNRLQTIILIYIIISPLWCKFVHEISIWQFHKLTHIYFFAFYVFFAISLIVHTNNTKTFEDYELSTREIICLFSFTEFHILNLSNLLHCKMFIKRCKFSA